MDYPEFKVGRDYNEDRGPTSKPDVDSTPLSRRMADLIIDRVGPATSPQHGLGSKAVDTKDGLSRT